jgi:hypothetical protein
MPVSHGAPSNHHYRLRIVANLASDMLVSGADKTTIGDLDKALIPSAIPIRSKRQSIEASSRNPPLALQGRNFELCAVPGNIYRLMSLGLSTRQRSIHQFWHCLRALDRALALPSNASRLCATWF